MAILSTPPEGAPVLDLDAARAARAEQRAASGGSQPVIKVGDAYVPVRPEIDLECVEDFSAGRLRAGMAKLLADPEDVKTLLAGGLSKDDLEVITQFVTGATLGESAASPRP